ncbi:MAG: protein jag [Spirochaetota bacterium]|nr:MAG: protein jag [Spirochaetota bacterium]
MEIMEYEGKTERDAIKKAAEDLGIESDKLNIEVISEKTKFFSFGNLVKIRVFLDEKHDDPVKKADRFLTGLFETIGIDITTQIVEDANKILVEIISDSSGLIIGKRGKTLEALQLLTNIIVNKNEKDWKKVVLDIENYRDRRENTLRELANKVASKVKKTGKPQLLEPMNPFERRVIHMTLQNDPQVATKSEGAGNLKKVKVFLKKRNNRR